MTTAILVENAEFGQDNAGQFVQYNVSVTSNGEEVNFVQRRYRDFKNFDGSWRKLYPNIACPIPKSVIFGANSPQVVSERIVGLTNYLRTLAEIKSVVPLLAAFLQVKSSYLNDMIPKRQQPAAQPAPAGPPRPRPEKKKPEPDAAANGGPNGGPAGQQANGGPPGQQANGGPPGQQGFNGGPQGQQGFNGGPPGQQGFTPQSGPAGSGPPGPRPGSRVGERTPPGSPPMNNRGPTPINNRGPTPSGDFDPSVPHLCQQCGQMSTGNFCNTCGFKLAPEPKPAFDPSVAHLCAQCGQMSTGNFCNTCGFKLAPDDMENSASSSSRSSASSNSFSASSQSSAGSAGNDFNGGGPAGRGRGGRGAPLPGFGNLVGGPGGRGGPGGPGPQRGEFGAPRGRGGPGPQRGGFGGRGGGGAPAPARKPTAMKKTGSSPNLAQRGGFNQQRGPFGGGGVRDRGASSPAAPSEASYSQFPSAAPSEFGEAQQGELYPPPSEFIGDIYEGRKFRRRKSFLKATTKDHWKVQTMSMVSRILEKNRDNYCIFSDTALVYDPTFKSTKRILMMTDKALYLLSPGTLTSKWRVNIRDIGAVSLSTQADHFFVIHPARNGQPDQMVLCPRKTELLVALRYVMAVQFQIGLEMTFTDDISVQLKPPVRSTVSFREKQSFGDESVNLQVNPGNGATITVSVPPNLLADTYNDAPEQQRIVEETEAQLYG